MVKLLLRFKTHLFFKNAQFLQNVDKFEAIMHIHSNHEYTRSYDRDREHIVAHNQNVWSYLRILC